MNRGDAPAVVLLEPLGRGGIADYTAELATALAALGVQVDVVTASDHLYPVDPAVSVHPVVRWMRGSSPLRRALRSARLGPAVNAVGFLLGLPQILALARRASLVHVQGPYHPPLLALTVALLRGFGVPTVHTPHNSFDRGRREHVVARRMLARLVSATVLHVHADLPRFPAEGRSRAVVIPHGEYGGLAARGGVVDAHDARAALGLDDGRVTVLLFGQMRADKGIRDLLEAARSVPDVTLLLAGEEIGGLAAARDVLEAPELAGRTLVHEGFHSMPAVARFFAAADVVALPYRIASQSGVLLLAYGFSRPVTIYPVAALMESVEDGVTGWVAASCSVDALAETLREIAAAGRAECARRGQAGRRLAEERFAWDRVAERTEAMYRSVLDGSHGHGPGVPAAG